MQIAIANCVVVLSSIASPHSLLVALAVAPSTKTFVLQDRPSDHSLWHGQEVLHQHPLKSCNQKQGLKRMVSDAHQKDLLISLRFSSVTTVVNQRVNLWDISPRWDEPFSAVDVVRPWEAEMLENVAASEATVANLKLMPSQLAAIGVFNISSLNEGVLLFASPQPHIGQMKQKSVSYCKNTPATKTGFASMRPQAKALMCCTWS